MSLPGVRALGLRIVHCGGRGTRRGGPTQFDSRSLHAYGRRERGRQGRHTAGEMHQIFSVMSANWLLSKFHSCTIVVRS